MPKISVIIPCFNQGQFVDEAVDSILNQTFQDFEIIIINDGSSDEFTVNKLNDYSKPKTKIIHINNQGSSAARNTGFKLAKGDYIQFLDADDIVSPVKFEEQLKIFKMYPYVEVCYSDYRVYDIRKQDFLQTPEKIFLGDEPLHDFLFKWERGLSIPLHCALFNKNIWRGELPFNEKFRAKEDWLMWCELALRGTNFYFLNSEYAHYRLHGENKTKNKIKMYYSFFLVVFYLFHQIPDKYKEEFLMSSILHNRKILENDLHPELVNQIIDLKSKFIEMDKTIDYRIGNSLLKPYRFIKSKLFGKKYI